MKDSQAGRRKGDGRNRVDGDAGGAWRWRVGLQVAARLHWSSSDGKAEYECGSTRRSLGRCRFAMGTLLAGKSASGPTTRLASPTTVVLHEEKSGVGQKRVRRGVR
jgi:hypothetical protein